ncbi:MAG: TorF family putative porin [Gammaproteobacteria bacterium]|nr:TorF family putative porin [Gammaproteobacteria bacterium]MBU1600476.1 TorF family putative porin [Gammaproteobacteria bacterium]MBU2434932.1 TorF family putative porin [Gammaproteobacteria bacterium]MBU2448168.1 TorF family putative porin [Gammaproteobacteria bacterium]
MKKSLVALAIVGAFAAPAFAEEAPASPHSVTANVTLASDYIFRGVSQSQSQPAIQGGFDYSHSSGVYVGTWASNVGWVTRSDYSAKDNNSMEWDFYAGYRGGFAEDFTYDVGAIKYYYPGSGNGNATADSTEVYAAIGWKFITLKYSYAVSSYLFGWTGTAGEKTRGSGYIDLSASYDLGNGWGINGHVGHQDIKDNTNASYTDWKLGVSKDVGFGVVGLAYTGTDAEGCDDASVAYCWNGKDVAKDTAVLSFTKSF